MSYADFLGIERIDHGRGKLRQSNSGGAICRRFPNFCLYVCVQFGGIAIRVGTSVGIAAHIGEEQFVVSGALGALDAASCGGNKLRIAFVERRLFQEQEDVMPNPLLQVPNRKQNALGLGSGSVPLLAEAIGECLFLLRWLQFGEE